MVTRGEGAQPVTNQLVVADDDMYSATSPYSVVFDTCLLEV